MGNEQKGCDWFGEWGIDDGYKLMWVSSGLVTFIFFCNHNKSA